MAGFKTALIVGATGFVGSYASNAFLNAPGWTVYMLVSTSTQENKKDVIEKYVAQGAKIITGDVGKPETYEKKLLDLA